MTATAIKERVLKVLWSYNRKLRSQWEKGTENYEKEVVLDEKYKGSIKWMSWGMFTIRFDVNKNKATVYLFGDVELEEK